MEAKIAVSNLRFEAKPTRIDWAELNDSFENFELEPMMLVDLLYQGKSISPWMNGRRCQKNFILGQHLAVDMDTKDQRSSMAELMGHPLVSTYGAIVHQTLSHKDDAPKSRVIFILDRPLKNPAGYRAALATVTSLFDGADTACVDPARFVFGNGRLAAEQNFDGIVVNKNPLLPVDEVRVMHEALQRDNERVAPAHQPRQQNTAGPAKFSPQGVLDKLIAKAGEGNRNAMGYWYAQRFKENEYSEDMAAEWLLKFQAAVTHYGDTPYDEFEALRSVRSAYMS